MKQRWGDKIARDPYYNPNLSLEREDFTLSFPLEATQPNEGLVHRSRFQ